MFILINFLRNIVRHRRMIRMMVLQELRRRYVGTLGGIVWAVINPLATIVVFWLVFAYGLKVEPSGGYPFILVFLAGLIPWLTFAEAVQSSVGVLQGNAHLVKKVVFPTEILPVVQLLASLIVHVVLLAGMAGALAWYQVVPGLALLTLPIYTLGLCLLVLGLAWILAALNAFFRDIGQVIGVVINIWFWLTPIVWPDTMLGPKWHWLLHFNPMVYVVEGYRAALLYNRLPDFATGGGVVFWCSGIFLFVLGAMVFRRLKPEFAEVL